jgi:hypothetical protein
VFLPKRLTGISDQVHRDDEVDHDEEGHEVRVVAGKGLGDESIQ